MSNFRRIGCINGLFIFTFASLGLESLGKVLDFIELQYMHVNPENGIPVEPCLSLAFCLIIIFLDRE